MVTWAKCSSLIGYCRWTLISSLLPVPCPDLPRNAQEDHHECLEPSESEVHTAVRKLKNSKAPGLCGITAEMLKASGNPGIQWLTGVIKQVWQSGLIPSGWKKGIILPIYKGKGSPKDCRNYRGITHCQLTFVIVVARQHSRNISRLSCFMELLICIIIFMDARSAMRPCYILPMFFLYFFLWPP